MRDQKVRVSGSIPVCELRFAWDIGKLRTLTKNTPARATGAHISIIGHITVDELRRHLGATEMANGFANRFLWVGVRRSKLLPEGGRMHTVDVAELVRDLSASVTFAKQTTRALHVVDFDERARELWHVVYGALSEGADGLLGALTARAEAQTRRLAVLYALLDSSPTVQATHLLAALALWDYCHRSAEHIFGDSLGDPVVDELLRALRGREIGLTKTEIRDLFGRHKRGDEIDRALGVLLERGLADYEMEQTGGRSAERWYATATKAIYATEAPLGLALASLRVKSSGDPGEPLRTEP